MPTTRQAMKLRLGRIRDSCDPGFSSSRPRSTTQDALMSLFTHILKIFKHRKIFEDAPSFFVVYAWDQPSHPDLPADSSIVQEMIQWFEDAGYSTMYSDSSPPSEKAVIDGQLRLLPIAAYPDSVQNVILCGSELLGHYMAGSSFKKYASDMKSSYTKARIKSRAAMSQTLRIVQRRHYERAIKNDFHHVMKELALLKIRKRYNEKSTIIPYLLNGDPQSCLPKYITTGSDNLRVQLGVDGSKYECFFEILGKLVGLSNPKLEPGPQHLIPCMMEIYKRAASELSYMDRVPEEFLERYQSEANKASDDFSSAQRQNPKGIGVSAVREALDAYHSEITSIERVFGETLPLRKHHIDLTVVEHFDPKKEGIKSAGPIYVTIGSLFNERELKGGNIGQPTRILIHGRPGIGKTTLCKQILDEYGRQEVRGALFSWVLWVPLRKLGLDDSLKSFFRSEYFHGKLYEELLAEKLYQQVFGEDKKKTLLILDGLDESSGWEERNIREIAQFKTIVFTTRSGRGRAGSAVYTIVDLELEAIGFNIKVACDYIESQTAVQSRMTAIDIRSFIARSPGRLLAQTPICLDILCSSWDDLRQAMPSDGIPPLTVLYQVVVARLWRRDILRLGKCDPLTGSVITKDILDAVRDVRRLDRVISVEMTFLETLAITLTKRGKIEFGDDEIIDTMRQVECKMPLPISLDYNLRNLSFLHSDGYGGYSFIHLTFQEYFAASWLSRHMPSLPEYMVIWKYHPRFERIWQFTAGFLQTKERLLHTYFKLIESEPLDLLGPTHQRLLMRCFNEVRHSVQPPIRTEILHKLADWLEFKCEISAQSFLRTTLECPYEVLETFLSKSALMCARTAHKDLFGFMFLPPTMLEALIPMVNSESKNHHIVALGLLYTQREFSPASSQNLIRRLTKRDEDTGYSNTFALRKLSDSSVIIAESLLSIFKYSPELSQAMRCITIIRLCKALDIHEPGFYEATLAGCMTLLQDRNQDSRVRIAAADILWHNGGLSDETVQSLADVLRDSSKSIRDSVARVIGTQSQLSVETIEILMTILKDDDEDARQAVALVFSEYLDLSEPYIGALATLVRDSNTTCSIQSAAATILAGQRSISDDAIAALVSLHKHDNEEIRASSARALDKYMKTPDVWKVQPPPTKAIKAALMTLLKDPVDFVQKEAASVLHRRFGVSQKTTAVLRSKPWYKSCIQKAKIENALWRARYISVTFDEVVAVLKMIPGNNMVSDIFCFLKLSENVWKYKTELLLARIGIRDPIIITNLVQTNGREHWSQLLINLLMIDKHLRENSWSSLILSPCSQISLSQANMQKLLRALQDSSGYGSRIWTTKVLACLSTWPECILKAVMDYLQDEEHLYAFRFETANNPEFLNKLLPRAGLLSEAEARDEPERKAVLTPYFLKSIYRVLLFRSFDEQIALYIDHERGQCVLYEWGKPRIASLEETLGTASIEERRQHCSYYTAIREIRERWNPRGLALWN